MRPNSSPFEEAQIHYDSFIRECLELALRSIRPEPMQVDPDTSGEQGDQRKNPLPPAVANPFAMAPPVRYDQNNNNIQRHRPSQWWYQENNIVPIFNEQTPAELREVTNYPIKIRFDGHIGSALIPNIREANRLIGQRGAICRILRYRVIGDLFDYRISDVQVTENTAIPAWWPAEYPRYFDKVKALSFSCPDPKMRNRCELMMNLLFMRPFDIKQITQTGKFSQEEIEGMSHDHVRNLWDYSAVAMWVPNFQVNISATNFWDRSEQGTGYTG